MEGLQKTRALVETSTPAVKVVVHVADITIADAVEGMIKKCVEHFGRLDFAMNNAGFAAGGTKTADLSTDLFDKMCNINEKGVSAQCHSLSFLSCSSASLFLVILELVPDGLIANRMETQTFLCLKYEIAQMLKQEPLEVHQEDFGGTRDVRGSIVNTASLTASIILKDFSGYASSKHAVGMMTKQLAREYAPSKIRINAVNPGSVMTPMIAASGLTEEFLKGLSRQAPMNRFILAEEVADAVVFLSSSSASAITGVNLPVDCGAALYHQTA